MSKIKSDELFQLIKTLDKGEKRNFKLYMGKHAGSEDMKIVRLFDALERLEFYDEDAILKKNPSIQKKQLSNLKAHLYSKILGSLRLIRNDLSVDIQLHEQLDHARILYNKGLYVQSLKLLQKIKELAKSHNQITHSVQALFLEKKIEALHITRSFEDKAEVLSLEVNELNNRLTVVGSLSNLALQLYGWYIKNGHARDEREKAELIEFFNRNLPEHAHEYTGFYEKLYFHQSQAWYGFILQDFLSYYKHCQRWVDLFDKDPRMAKVESQHYIKGMHNLLNAHFMLRNYKKFSTEIERFENFFHSDVGTATINARVQSFVYLYLAKINWHFMAGTFSEGLKLVPEIESHLKEFDWQLDRHRILMFYYKIACLFFGCANYDKAIEYLNKIIHLKADLRTDLQCYARLLHLISHYELGNDAILDSQVKSVYRFMSNMKRLSTVESEIFSFLKLSLTMGRGEMRQGFLRLYKKLKQLENNNLESRSFIYLDILSWLQSKIKNTPVEQVIAERFTVREKELATAS
jgi:tetratricopeptide (TPR) repeat protein